MTAELKTM